MSYGALISPVALLILSTFYPIIAVRAQYHYSIQTPFCESCVPKLVLVGNCFATNAADLTFAHVSSDPGQPQFHYIYTSGKPVFHFIDNGYRAYMPQRQNVHDYMRYKPYEYTCGYVIPHSKDIEEQRRDQ